MNYCPVCNLRLEHYAEKSRDGTMHRTCERNLEYRQNVRIQNIRIMLADRPRKTA